MESSLVKLAMFSFLVVSLFMSCDPANSKILNSLSSGEWHELVSADGSIPIKRHEAAFVGIDNKLVLLGGRGVRPVSIYDIEQEVWTNGQEPPLELHHFQPVVHGNEILIMGAMTGSYPGETPVENICIYNLEENSWTIGAPIPSARARGGAGACIVGKKIYLACGIKDGHRGDHKNWLDVYDMETGAWEKLADAPRARDHFQMQHVEGKLYLLGGRTTISSDNPFKNTIQEVDVYDIEKKKWKTLRNKLPTPRAGNFTVVVGDQILVIGGESFYQQAAHPEVEALNIKTNKWTVLPELPQGRHGTGAVLHKNKLYTASGCGNRGGNPELEDLYSFTLANSL